MRTAGAERRPLIVHVIHHLITGGLENGLVNLINHLPERRYRHAVVCMTGHSEFRDRIRRPDVAVYAMHKREGQDPATQLRLLRLFRRLRPAAVHGRNLSGLDGLLPALLAGVRVRIHGEHGRDMRDLDGASRKLIWLRRLHSPFVSRYVAVNADLEAYLTTRVGIRPDRITRIGNGVEVARFRAPAGGSRELFPAHLRDPGLFVVGTVGRMQPVKDPCNLARAFVRAVAKDGTAAERLRLVMVGDGPQLADVVRILDQAGAMPLAWLAGDRADVARLLCGFDLFVSPSLTEGVSNTILEAMASGLPVLATRVGGNPDLIEDGNTGRLVAAADSEALADGILEYLRDPARAIGDGEAGRRRTEREFSLERMVASYDELYSSLLRRRAPAPSAPLETDRTVEVR